MSDPAAQPPRSEALESFVGKWLLRWPEWSLAEVFVPEAQRESAVAWAALLQELTDAAWSTVDPRPGEVKLAWWQEELHGWAAGRRRHPLGAVLQRQQAPWKSLAQTLVALPASRERARDPEELFAALAGFSAAVAAVESALFEGGGEEIGPADAAVVATSLLANRAAQAGDRHVPLSFL
ncbi:MAG: phytoene/squalene synthase family protein, partial [Lysobacter sp.]|nr:phytoene/squalene synthase family protein [Lysobacter sp.]